MTDDGLCIEDTNGIKHLYKRTLGWIVPACGMDTPAYFRGQTPPFKAIPTCLWCAVAARA